MSDADSSKKLTWVVGLLAANLLVMTIGAGAIVFMLLPKVERAVVASERAIEATERVESRFQSFADEVQPVLTAGAGKAVEAISKVDADRLSETATEKADSLLDAAAEKAKRFLDRDKEDKQE